MTEETRKDQAPRGPLDPVYNEPRVNQLITHGHGNAARLNEIFNVGNWKKLMAVAFVATILGFVWTFGATWTAKQTTHLIGGGVVQQEGFTDGFIEPILEEAEYMVESLIAYAFGAQAPTRPGANTQNTTWADLREIEINKYFEEAQKQVPISTEIPSLVSVGEIPALVKDLGDVSLKNWDFPVSEGTFVTMDYLAKNGATNPVTGGLDGFLVVPSSVAMFGNIDLDQESYEKDFLITGWALNEKTNQPVLVFGAVHEGEFFDLALTEADRLDGYENYAHTDLPIFLQNIQLPSERDYSPFGSYAEGTWDYQDYMTALRELDIDESRIDYVSPEDLVAPAIDALVKNLNETGEILDQIIHVVTDEPSLSDFQDSDGLYSRMVVMKKPDSKDMMAVFPTLSSSEKVQISAFFLSYKAPETEEVKGTYEGTFIVPTFEGERSGKSWATFGDYPVLKGRAAQKLLMHWGSDAYRARRNENNNEDK